MSRPCKTRLRDPHPTPRPDNCPMCWRVVYDERFSKLWGEPSSLAVRRYVPPTAPTVYALPVLRQPCLHLGEIVEHCPRNDPALHIHWCDHPDDHGMEGRVQRGRYCANCPDYAAPPPSFPIRFDETNLGVGIPGKRFNCSVLSYGDGYLFSFRNGWAGSEIYVVRLDKAFQPIETPRRLELFHQTKANYGREDGRLFMYHGQVHIAYVGVSGRFGPTHVLYARLRNDLTVEQIYYPHYSKRNSWEKSWGFFEHDGELFSIYHPSPHRILRIAGEQAEMVYETPAPVNWPTQYGELRGGASPVRVGNEYWHFFHTKIAPHYPPTAYHVGLYTFEAKPPFAMKRIITEPLITSDPTTKPADQYCPCIFVCGSVRTGDDWYLSCGIHDRHSEIHAFVHTELDRRLIPV